MARRFSITFYKGTLNIGGMRASMGYGHSVTVGDDEDESVAIARAREEVAAMDDWREYATGRADAVEMFRWAITLRGRDKRERETFIVVAEDERCAYRNLGHLSAATRFAGYGFGPKTRRGVTTEDERIVKIEKRPYG